MSEEQEWVLLRPLVYHTMIPFLSKSTFLKEDDYYQIAYLTYYRSLKNFSPEQGVKFTTYLVRAWQQEFQKEYLKMEPMINFSHQMRKELMQLKYRIVQLQQQLERTPTWKEILVYTGFTNNFLAQYFYYLYEENVDSFSAPYYITWEEEKVALDMENKYDQEVSLRENELAFTKEQLRQILNYILTEEEQVLFEYHFFHGYKYREIASHFEYSYVTVGRKIEKALKKVRHFYETSYTTELWEKRS